MIVIVAAILIWDSGCFVMPALPGQKPYGEISWRKTVYVGRKMLATKVASAFQSRAWRTKRLLDRI